MNGGHCVIDAIVVYSEKQNLQMIMDGAQKRGMRTVSESTVEACIESAIRLKAWLIIDMFQPAYIAQDMFEVLEEYETLPMMLTFKAMDKRDIIYAVSGAGKTNEREELTSFFREIFIDTFGNVLEYRSSEGFSNDTEAGKIVMMERNAYLMDILRGATAEDVENYMRTVELDLKKNGYYLFMFVLHQDKGTEYFHHSRNKDIYHLVGELLRRECTEAIRSFNGGEVFYASPLVLYAIINDTDIQSAREKNRRWQETILKLCFYTGCKAASRYLSGRISSIEALRDAYESLMQLKIYDFFCRDRRLITAEDISASRKAPDYERINELLRELGEMISGDIGNNRLIPLLNILFLDYVRPTYDFNLYLRCYSTVISTVYDSYSDILNRDSLEWQNQRPAALGPSIEAKLHDMTGIISALREQAAFFGRSKKAVVNQAVQYIENHFFDGITLKTLAKKLSISSVYLSQLFKRELGMGFNKYLVTCRINHAKSLLANTDELIFDIAIKCGFGDSKHFSKTFKRLTGATPSMYRKSTAKQRMTTGSI